MRTRGLIVAATIFDAVLAGAGMDRVLVQMPAWRVVGVAGWAAYSRHADLGNGLVLYPIVAIADCALSVTAAMAVARERAVWRAATIPPYLAAALTVLGLLLTIKAAPFMLSLRRVGNDPMGLQLRRHIERVAAQRRALPPGGQPPQDFGLVSEKGPACLSTLFGDKDTLIIYSMMYGPQRQAPCPMCTSFLSSWNGTAVNLRERVAMAVTARSPIDRLVVYKKQRGFANLAFASDMSGEYTRTHVNPEDAGVPGFSVFSRRDGIIRHFYTGEMSGAMADPGQDPRGGPDLDPLWLMLDLTPGGRGTDWYPKLDYGHAPTSEHLGQGR